jgi:hypothetical protein
VVRQTCEAESCSQGRKNFLDAAQTGYERKNWSSVMFINCAKCAALTPEQVNSAIGLELRQFKWLSDAGLIGEIPAAWNHLAGYDKPRKDASLVRFIIGGPCFNEYASCEYAEE